MSDTMHADIVRAQKGILAIYARRKVIVQQLCSYYASKALEAFRRQQTSKQLSGTFWTNQTVTARNTVFSGVEAYKQFYGFFLAHKMQYGIYLELANNAKHEALRPIVLSLYNDFEKDLKELFGDN